VGLSPDIIAKFESLSSELTKGRKKRQPPPGQASLSTIQSFSETEAHQLHPVGSVCVDMHPSEMLCATGGSDGKIVLFDCEATSKVSTLPGHSAPVSVVRFVPRQPLIMSGSDDAVVCCWSQSDGGLKNAFKFHSDCIVGCAPHPSGDYCASASRDKSWALLDIEQGSCIVHVKVSDVPYTCAEFHPDGLLLGTGVANTVQIWDVKTQSSVASFDSHSMDVTSMSFSENGYYLATGSADATVKIWDLRKLKNLVSLHTSQHTPVSSVRFDYSGQFLAVGSSEVSVFESKKWGVVQNWNVEDDQVTGVQFGKCAGLLASSTGSGSLRLYGSSA